MPEPNSEVSSRSGSPIREIVLPLAVVISLIGSAWWSGVGWGTVATKLDTLTTLVSSVQSDVGILRGDVAALEKRQADLEARLKTQEDAFRLFKMYTKGRIARLPYRSTDDGE